MTEHHPDRVALDFPSGTADPVTGFASGIDGLEAPILVEVTRNGFVESRHRAIAAIANSEGRVLAGWGDVTRPVLPRSAIKSLQALPLIESGAFDRFKLDSPELALACASHNGERRHTRLAAGWLERLGLTLAHLECGVHPPFDQETALEMMRSAEPPTTLHNNCSGKHLGMLTTALHLGEPVRGYSHADHPVQRRIRSVIEQMTGVKLGCAPWGTDGCGVPTLAIPLSAIALAMARIADPRHQPPNRVAAIEQIRQAWARHSYLVGGRTSFDTRIIQAAGGQVLVKCGAEGVSCAVLPRQGLGIALKIEDGSARARDVVMAALLRRCRVLDPERWAKLAELAEPPVLTCNGHAAGSIRPAEPWPAPLGV